MTPKAGEWNDSWVYHIEVIDLSWEKSANVVI
jgi:hypothetical protein